MPKRKFAAFAEPSSIRQPNDNSGPGNGRVLAVLDNGTTSITHALKIARGFERQKLGRRQKIAKDESSQPDVTGRLNAEVTALKALDLARTAELHLYKTLLKVKRISESSTLPDRVRHAVISEKPSNDVANTNVQARLFNSAPVKSAVGQVLNDVGHTLGIKDIGGHAGRKRLRAKDFEKKTDGNSSKDIGVEVVRGGRSINADETNESAGIWPGLGNGKDSAGKQAYPMNYVDYESRVNGSDEEATASQESHNISRHSNSDWSGSEDERDRVSGISDDDNTHARSLPRKSKPKKPTNGRTEGAPLTSTTFLPSLSMGGYWSGGSDDNEDQEDGSMNGLSQELKRKNKRGQRARQAIYEKKFGQNANHLKKQPQDSTKRRVRDQGWDPRSGARGDGHGRERRWQEEKDEFGRDVSRRKAKQSAIQGNRKQRRAAGKENQVLKSGANNDPVVNLRKRIPPGMANDAWQNAEQEALHPSWEAAKKAKETKKAMPFQGKKITFD